MGATKPSASVAGTEGATKVTVGMDEGTEEEVEGRGEPTLLVEGAVVLSSGAVGDTNPSTSVSGTEGASNVRVGVEDGTEAAPAASWAPTTSDGTGEG